MKDHPNTVTNRLAHLDKLADQIADALALHGFVNFPRRADRNQPRSIRHRATQTSITFDLTGAHLGFYVAERGATSRTTFRTIRLGHSAQGAPLTANAITSIVFLARLTAAEFTIQDDQLRQAVA